MNPLPPSPPSSLSSEPDAYPWHRVRSALYDEIYVSPHMDDAVYSCGGQMALSRQRGARVLVLTVFGNGSAAEQGRGVFSDLERRKREELAALDVVDVDFLWLNFPDWVFRSSSAGELARDALPFASLAPSALLARVHAALSVPCTRLLAPGGRVYFPLAVGFHPDHRVVFEVGRALAERTRLPVSFYEDVPYAEVAALRGERLRHLGKPADFQPLRGAWAIQAFLFPYLKAWQQPFAAVFILGLLLALRALHGVLGRADPFGERLHLEERDISQVIRTKVEAMRAYETQTAFFYPSGDALDSRLMRSGDTYVERYWTPDEARAPTVLPLRTPDVERETHRLEALLRTLDVPRRRQG